MCGDVWVRREHISPMRKKVELRATSDPKLCKNRQNGSQRREVRKHHIWDKLVHLFETEKVLSTFLFRLSAIIFTLLEKRVPPGCCCYLFLLLSLLLHLLFFYPHRNTHISVSVSISSVIWSVAFAFHRAFQLIN